MIRKTKLFLKKNIRGKTIAISTCFFPVSAVSDIQAKCAQINGGGKMCPKNSNNICCQVAETMNKNKKKKMKRKRKKQRELLEVRTYSLWMCEAFDRLEMIRPAGGWLLLKQVEKGELFLANQVHLSRRDETPNITVSHFGHCNFCLGFLMLAS